MWTLVGEVDLATIPLLHHALRNSTAPHTVINLTHVDFLDLAGARAVAVAAELARESGRRFSVIAGTAVVRRVLMATGLADRLEIHSCLASVFPPLVFRASRRSSRPDDGGGATMPETDPAALNAAEDLDEDRLRLDPLEEGMDPPEHWSPEMEHGTTAREEREGKDLDGRLREEQPDTSPPPAPRDEVDRMDADGELEGHPSDDVPFAHEHSSEDARRGQTVDEDSVARELRTPRD
jgi:anti-anti-sigma factor